MSKQNRYTLYLVDDDDPWRLPAAGAYMQIVLFSEPDESTHYRPFKANLLDQL